MKESIVAELQQYLRENYRDHEPLLIHEELSFLENRSQEKAPLLLSPKKKQEEPPPIPIEEKEEALPPPTFLREKLVAEPTVIDGDLKALYKKIAPHLILSDAPPSDEVAKRIRLAAHKKNTLPSVPILFSPIAEEHFDFLTNLAKAISQKFGPSSLVPIAEFEEKNLWKPLLTKSEVRLILIPSLLLKHSPNLLSHTKEYPGRRLKSVEKVPLLTLSDISSSPVYKKELWNTLTRFFA